MIAYYKTRNKSFFKETPLTELLEAEHVNKFAMLGSKEYIENLAKQYDALEDQCNLIYFREHSMSYEDGAARVSTVPAEFVANVIELCEYHKDEVMIINSLAVGRSLFKQPHSFCVGIYPKSDRRWHQDLPVLFRKHILDRMLTLV